MTFSKLSGPQWLAVDAAGNLSGTPGPANLGTNAFVVRVADSTGFTDDATILVVVRDLSRPVLTASLVGSDLRLRLDGLAGQHYRIEYQPTLPPTGEWQMLTDIVSLAVSPLDISDPASNAQRFYRAVSLP